MAKDNAPALVELALKSSGGTLHLDDLEKLLKGRDRARSRLQKVVGRPPNVRSKRTVMSSCPPSVLKSSCPA
jgi:hypothetical protein